ncbi:MAG: S49 family peptidase [Haloferacaceae archaeon]
MSQIRTVLGSAARSYVLFVVLGVVLGLTLAPVAWQATDTDGTVAVVPVAGALDGGVANEYGSMLRKARQSGDVKAVVLVVNSGGGGASASESMYLDTKRTAEQMPVVASVDAAAASGAYYTIAPSDRIFAKPSSLLGSVGVVAGAPTDVEPNDIVATTGPNKLTGGDQREFYSIVESLGEAFYNAVERSRGDALKLSRTELAQARLYAGGQAVGNGLADEIGGRQAAIAHAAEQAGMDDYDVRVLQPDGPSRFVSRANYLGADVPNKRMVGPSYLLQDNSSAPVFLMVPGSYLDRPDTTERPRTSTGVDPVAAERPTNRTGVEPAAAAGVADDRVARSSGVIA